MRKKTAENRKRLKEDKRSRCLLLNEKLVSSGYLLQSEKINVEADESDCTEKVGAR